MAKEVLRLPPPRTTGPKKGNSMYPWDLWLNGDEHLLVQGVDFSSQVNTMRVNAHYMANKYKTFVRVNKLENGVIAVQAFNNSPGWRNRKACTECGRVPKYASTLNRDTGRCTKCVAYHAARHLPRECKVTDCNSASRTREMCSLHYKKWLKYAEEEDLAACGGLTEESVRRLRAEAAKGVSRVELAKKYHISRRTVHNAISRTTWKHVV